jgi:acetyl esterase
LVRRRLVVIVIVGAVIGLPTQSAPAAPTPDYDNLVYTQPGGVALTLDVYVPSSGSGPFPGLVIVHGGGFKKGSKENWAREGRRASRSGFVAYVIDYRLTCDPLNPPAGVDPALCGYKATAPVDDVHAAIAWVRSHAGEYGTDPNNIGVLGGSAGGNLAGMAGTTGTVGGDKADAVATWSGEVELKLRPLAPEVRYVGCKLQVCPEKWDLASPHFFVDSLDAPIYLANSTDEIIPEQEAIDVSNLATAAGVPNQLRLLEGTRHERAYKDDVWDETMAFLHTYLDP